MKRETLKALKGSIRHWKRNVAKATKGKLDGVDICATRCPLCQRFSNYCSLNGELCPVEKIDGLDRLDRHWINRGCSKTPWINVATALAYNYSYSKKDILSAAKEELNFLKGLLPKKKKVVKR